MGSTNPNVRVYISTNILAQQQLFFFCNLRKRSHKMSVIRMIFLICLVGIIHGETFNSDLGRAGMDDMEEFGHKEMSRSPDRCWNAGCCNDGDDCRTDLDCCQRRCMYNDYGIGRCDSTYKRYK